MMATAPRRPQAECEDDDDEGDEADSEDEDELEDRMQVCHSLTTGKTTHDACNGSCSYSTFYTDFSLRIANGSRAAACPKSTPSRARGTSRADN